MKLLLLLRWPMVAVLVLWLLRSDPALLDYRFLLIMTAFVAIYQLRQRLDRIEDKLKSLPQNTPAPANSGH
jgi:hypothetical protein